MGCSERISIRRRTKFSQQTILKLAIAVRSASNAQANVPLTLEPELARLGPEERSECVVEEVDDDLRLMCIEAAETRRDRLVMRQVRDECISRPATYATAGAPA